MALLLWGQLLHAADRFVAPTLLMAVVVGAAALRHLEPAGLPASLRRGLGLAVGVALLLGALLAIRQGRVLAPASVLARDMARARELARLQGVDPWLIFWREQLGVTAEMFAAANHLPAQARILTINEARRYPFARAVRVTSVFDRTPLREALRQGGGVTSTENLLAEAGFSHVLMNEFEQLRILRIHTPPELLHDSRLSEWLRENRQRELARTYWGYTEFSVDPLTVKERTIYTKLRVNLSERAVWSFTPYGAEGPAMRIAPLDRGGYATQNEY